MAAKTTAASVEKARKGFQQRTGVTLSSRSSEPLPVLSNANRARNTEKVLEELGQRDQARGSNTFSVEAAKSGSPIMSGWVNAMADNPKLANAATFLAGASLPYSEFRRQQDEKMKGTLTDEMKSAGLTQADLDAWNRQQNEIERQNVLSQYAKEHPVMSSLNAIPENAFGSIEGNIDKVLDFVKGNPIESKQTNADIYRQAVNENINSKLGRGAYNVANSVGDMLFASWLTGGLGGGGAEGAKGLAKLLKGLPAASVMGLEKSNATMNSAAERGLTNNQALAEGVLSGLSTAATEALPFGRFAEGGNILGSMAAEGLQEGAEGLLDTFFDELVTRVGGNGDKSELKTRYREYLNAGYNAEQARQAVANDYKTQVLTDIVMGGLAGGVMQAGSNAVSGRNVITGKIPSLNQNTEAQTETVEQPKEEAKVEQTVEQPVQTEQPIPTVQQTPVAQNENIPAVEQTANESVPQEVQNYVNNRDQLVNYVTQNQPGYEEGQQIIRSINAMDEYMFQKYPEWMDGETGQFKREEFDRLMQSQPIETLTAQQSEVRNTLENNANGNLEVLRNEAAETAIRNREAAQYAREVESLKDKLKMFGNKTFNKRLDAALKDVQSGKEGAVENLNNLINEINETMAGEEIGVNAREFNSDRYKVMQEATDGYRVRIDPNLVKNEYDVKGLDDFNRNYMNTGSPDHIKLVSPNYKGTALNIDRVYDELYGMNIGLEPPNGRSESDLLRSLVKFINEPKSGRDETVMNSTWENTPAMDNRTNIEVEADNLVDDLLNKMADRNATEEDYLQFIDFVLEKGKGQSEEVQDYLNDLFVNVSEVWKSMPKSNIPLDEDVQNITTLEEAITKLDEELGSHPYNLKFFARNQNNEVISEDSDRVQTGRYKTSKEYTNTAERSGNLTDDQRRMVEQNGSMLYQENSERESVAEAEKRIIKDGWENEYERLTSKDMKDFNNVDVDELFMVWRHYTEEARTLDEKGLDSTSAWQKAYDCFVQTKAVGSSAGSELQAFAKWSRNNTPEGLLSQAGTIIEEVKRGAKKNPWFAQIARETKGKTKEMDVPFIKEFLTEAEKLAPTHTVKEGETLAQIAQQYNTTVDALIALNGKKIKPGDKITVNRLDIDSREAKHIMANLGKMVNGQIPVTLREKVVTILMDNMLGNFRTLIARNAGGNVGFNLIEQNITKQLAAKIDKALSAKRGTTRTISENTKEGRQAGREGFKEALKQEIYDFQNNIQSARSGENNLRTAVANNRQIFSQKNVFGKIGNLYNKLVKAGLSSGDRPFYERVYSQYMTEFKKMRENGLLKEMTDAEFEELAKTNAKLKALEAVYQDDSSMAQAFIGMKNAVNELSRGIVGADVLSQFTMPFVKTPANIIQRAIEYSPIGIVKNAIQTVREVNHAMTENEIMDFDQQRFATETARNLIGSVMFAVAVMAAKSGALTGGYSEDKDMAQAQREAGMQEYALHNPLGFNGDVDVSWLPVLGNNMVAAAAAYDAASKPELTMGQRIGQGLTAGLRTQFESSALQGLQRLVGGSNYSSSNGGDLLTNAVDTLKSGATQFIPSLARQAAATADPYRRQLTGANPDDYYMNSVINSIPGLRQSLEPRISRTGEYMEQNTGRNGLWKAFDNFINPATITRGTEDAVRDEAMRLFEATGNNIAFQPGVSINELKLEDHVPTAEEFTRYQQNAYGAMNQIATQVINSSYYQNLTDGEKETLLDNIYKAVKSVEKANILGTDKSGLSGAAKAYDEGGAEGLINYATAKSVLTEMGMDNTVKNREYILETLNNGGTEAVNQILELSDELVNAGLAGSLTEQYAYNHAAQYIPSLTPSQFATEYTNLNYDGQSGITQKDILAYVNQNPTAYTEEDMYRLWNAYGQSSWAKIPSWNGSQWVAKTGSIPTTNTDDIGQYGAGNIDLYNRPQYINPDGSVSTVRSISYGVDDGVILIPTIAYRNGKPYLMSDDEAWDHYIQTGEYLGKFKTQREADEYAERLHQQQAQLYK
jgi:hypothetical protein